MNRGGEGSLIIIQLEMVSFPPVLLPKMARKTLNSPTSIWCPEPLRGKDGVLTFEAKWDQVSMEKPHPLSTSTQQTNPSTSQKSGPMLHAQQRTKPIRSLPSHSFHSRAEVDYSQKNIGKLQPVSQVLGRRCARW